MVGRRVLVYTDNQSAAGMMDIGSRRPELQKILRKIFAIAMRNSFVLVPRWRRRNTDDMQQMDTGTKMDSCDFQLEPRVFAALEAKWKISHAVDCFATKANTLTADFYSRFYCRGSSGVDALAYDWARAVGTAWKPGRQPVAQSRPWCWVHPPRAMIGQTLRHMQRCGAKATVLVPLDRSEVWWPLVAAGSRGTVTSGGRPRRRRIFRRRTGLLNKSGAPMAPGFRDLIAVQVDFRACDTAVSASPQWERCRREHDESEWSRCALTGGPGL